MVRPAAVALVLAVIGCGGDAPPPPKEPAPPLVIPPVASATAPKTSPALPKKAEYERLVAKLRDVDDVQMDVALNDLRKLADPRSADAIAQLLERTLPPKTRSLATQALYELRDMRAVPHLVAMFTSADPMDGIIAARGLSDLALISPEQRADLRAAAEDAVLAWLAKQPYPHANGMKFLALVQSPRGIAKLRAWADPPDPLPKKGVHSPFPQAFAIAQSALRWLGATRDEKAQGILVKQLNRRPTNADVTADAMEKGGTALLGLSVRALTLGAIDGMAEAGDSKSVPALLAFVQEPKNNEQSRLEACVAIGALASETQIREIAAKLKDPGVDAEKIRVTTCLVVAVDRRADDVAAAKLLPLIAKNVTTITRFAAANAMGSAPLDKATVAALRPLLDDAELRTPAAIALVLGGGVDEARAACAKLDAVNHGELAQQVHGHLDVLVERWVRDHALSRMVYGVRACGVDVVTKAMTDAMGGISYDIGAGTLSRIVGRWLVNDGRLVEDRRVVLEALGERGLLDADR